MLILWNIARRRLKESKTFQFAMYMNLKEEYS